MQTRATPDPDVEGGYVLNGTKCWISGGMQADWFVVFAKTGDPASRRTRTSAASSSSRRRRA